MDWVTTTIILEELSSSEGGPVWERFCRFCRPMIIGRGIQFGLDEPDAQDVAQETLIKFIELYREGEYKRQKGGLRKWLMGIARNKMREKRRKFSRERLVADSSTGTSFWNSLEDEKVFQETWDADWHIMIMRICLNEIKSQYPKNVYDAFVSLVLDGRPIEEVAEKFNIKEGTLRVHKHRMVQKLRKLAAKFEKNNL